MGVSSRMSHVQRLFSSFYCRCIITVSQLCCLHRDCPSYQKPCNCKTQGQTDNEEMQTNGFLEFRCGREDQVAKRHLLWRAENWRCSIKFIFSWIRSQSHYRCVALTSIRGFDGGPGVGLNVLNDEPTISLRKIFDQKQAEIKLNEISPLTLEETLAETLNHLESLLQVTIQPST